MFRGQTIVIVIVSRSNNTIRLGQENRGDWIYLSLAANAIYSFFHLLHCIVLAYLMLFAALTNSVCLNNASLFFFFLKIFFFYGRAMSSPGRNST